ncbi:hypothetical protein [Phycicoccus ginsengisoli]
MLLSDDEIGRLEEGEESVLEQWTGVCLGDLLMENVDLGDGLSWVWPGQ